MIEIVSASPFDAIRRIDDGGEHWSARELMPLLGYTKWERFEAAIQRAAVAARNSGQDPYEAFTQVIQLPGAGNLGPQERRDFRLTRYGAYMAAMNGDPRKPEIAAAQTYFAIKTREAEVVKGPDDDLDALAGMLAAIRSQRAELRAQQERTAALEAKVSAIEGQHDWFTALGYAKLHDHPTDRPSLAKIGRRATAIMRDRGEQPERRQDATFGAINVYPVDVLEQAFGTVR